MTTKKEQRRVKIKYRVRNKISGTAARPRLTVFRSNKQIYVQIINDETSSTLVAASSLGMETMPKKEQAAKVGEAVAAKAIAAGITEVVFDRNGNLNQILLSCLNALGNSSCNFTCLTKTVTNDTLTITNYYNSSESESTATLGNLDNTIDSNQSIL